MRFLLFVIVLFFQNRAIAQTATPFRSESDAVDALDRIEHWRNNFAINDSVNTVDSLYKANEIFLTEFISWLNKDVRTMAMPFAKLKEMGVTIAESKDKKLRVYSWDTWTGGTMHFYEAVIQYKTTSGVKALQLADPEETEEGTPGNWYKRVDLLKTAAGKTIYLLTGHSVLSTRETGRSMMGVAINGSKLEQNLKIFKTVTGLTDELYAGFTIGDSEKDYSATIEFNEKTKQILVPQVNEDTWLLTGKKEIYFFNGKYFQRKK